MEFERCLVICKNNGYFSLYCFSSGTLDLVDLCFRYYIYLNWFSSIFCQVLYERRIFMEIFLNGFFSYGSKYCYGNFLEWLLQRKFSKEYLLFNGFLSSFHLFFVVYYPIIFLPFLVKWVTLNWVWDLFVFNVKKLITCCQKLHFYTPW